MTDEIPYTDTAPTDTTASPDQLPLWEMIALAVGDLIALILFAIAGRSSHGVLAQSGFLGVLNTAIPFMLSWLITSAIVGTFNGKALYPLGRVIWKTAAAGIGGGLLGVIFWGLSSNRWPPAPTFFLVGTLTSTLSLLIWRVLWSRVRRLWWPELP